MVTITENIYRSLARKLHVEFGSGEFFNGRVECDGEDFSSHLRATLIIYRDPQAGVTDVVPVWWEYHMEQCHGEVLTDFCWSEFKGYLSEYL